MQDYSADASNGGDKGRLSSITSRLKSLWRSKPQQETTLQHDYDYVFVDTRHSSSYHDRPTTMSHQPTIDSARAEPVIPAQSDYQNGLALLPNDAVRPKRPAPSGTIVSSLVPEEPAVNRAPQRVDHKRDEPRGNQKQKEDGNNNGYQSKGKKKKNNRNKGGKNHNQQGSDGKDDEPRMSKPVRTVMHGKIARIIPSGNGDFGFIKSLEPLPPPYENKDVHFHVDKISAGDFPIRTNDAVSFVLNAHRTEKPNAMSVNLVQCCYRSESQIEDYLSKLSECLNADTVESENDESISTTSNIIVSLLHCPAVFKCIGGSRMSIDTIQCLINVLLKLRSRSQSLETYLKSCFREMMKTPLMNARTGLFKEYVTSLSKDRFIASSNKLRLFEFVQMMVDLVPEKARAMVSIIKPLISDSSPIEKLLYSLLKSTSRSNYDDPSDMDWDELPLVPSVKELLGDPVETLSCLSPVVRKGPYKSANEYMDTYFRLLRADCFGALQEGVQKLARREKVDQRDMKIYFALKLVGMYLPQKEGGVSLGLQFTPVQKKVRWSTASNLMYGNLLCISVSGTFRDPIWATVSTRDTNILEKTQTIFIELCSESNMLPDSEVIALLSSSQGRGVMVESPTYYKAYQPVLRKLQAMNPEDLPFQDELVFVKPPLLEVNEPCYINSSSMLLPAIIFDGIKKVNVNYEVLESLAGRFSTSLDDFQLKAVLHMLQNHVAIVQGPPGTGKTYIGIKLILTLRTISTLPPGPILLLTYKNHALDEFIKGVAAHIDKDKITRVGGRSKDSELAECNLANKLRNYKTNDSKQRIKKIMQKKDEIFNMRKKLVNSLKRLSYSRTFNSSLLLKYLGNEQISDFLSGSLDKPQLGYIQSEIQEILKKKSSGDLHKTPIAILDSIFKAWYPKKDIVTQVENELGLIGIKLTQVTDIQSSKEGKKEDEKDELYDEKDIEDMQKERATAMTASASYKEVNNNDLFKLTTASDSQPVLFSAAKNVTEQLPSATLMNVESLWGMSPKDRVLFVQCILVHESIAPTDEFQGFLKEFQHLSQEKEELEIQDKIELLSQSEIIGMTITGASIYQKILAEVKPAIVIVEEAAEILEPQLIASLGPWVKHLVMIGDHKQLRPGVESFDLVKNFHFDVSMMERLIDNKLPFQTLGKQNRMRPEFSRLLLDIYPSLQDNLARVQDNAVANCIRKSMFFWSHSDLEKEERSYRNEGEADRVVKLALFLMQQGNSPDKITILAAYQGQVALLRKKLRKAETDHADIFNKYCEPDTGNSAESSDKRKYIINVHTIDMFQGDENDFVIVSLVRSNDHGRVGFLKLLNRRCVAQSRSRCGLYFVGNGNLMSTVPHWSKMISSMERDSCYGTQIELICPHHTSSRLLATSADDINLKTFCNYKCVLPVRCSESPPHPCPKLCQPPHSHDLCRTKVHHIYERCGHSTVKECWQTPDPSQCRQPCIKRMNCYLHVCPSKCGPPHSHSMCSEEVDFTCRKCGHAGSKMCHENVENIKCLGEVSFIFSTCRHPGTRKCFQDVSKLKCKSPCRKMLPCKHLCQLNCSDPCIPDACKTCEKIRKIEEEKKLALEKQLIEDEKLRIKAELKKIQDSPIKDEVVRIELSNDGDTAHEYLKVEDKVRYYVQPGHKWYPVVTKIEKIINPKLENKWLLAKSHCHDPRQVDSKFHGTSKEAVDIIVRDGFKLPSKPGMFGRGIYFATDSSKSAQKIYTKGSGMLLLCDIVLGKIRTVNAANHALSSNTLAALGYDSVFAKRDTKEKGGVLYDEYVVFNPDQAIPRYVVHYQKEVIIPSSASSFETIALMGTGPPQFQHIKLQPKRTYKLDDQKDQVFRLVESQFLRLMTQTGKTFKILSVDYYINPPLVAQYRTMAAQLKKKYPAKPELAEEILAFHGTKSLNIDGIVKNNFDIKKLSHSTGDNGWYGAGIYFSEFPTVSLTYGKSLLLCRVLPGKSLDLDGSKRMDGAPLTPGYDSHRVKADNDGRGEELVIFDPAQILPSYVINYS